MFTGRFTPDDVDALNTISVDTDYFETGWAYTSDLTCLKDPDARYANDRPYRGQIVEKEILDDGGDGQEFIGSLGARFPSLWELIARGPTRRACRVVVKASIPREFYNGSEILYEVVVPWLLFDMRVIMRWDIVHTNYPGT